MSDQFETATHTDTQPPTEETALPAKPSPVDSYHPKIVMSIHAHPDDQEFSVAGTLAKWARMGSEIISVIITSGDAGSNDPQHDEAYKPILAALREGEQRAANAIIGVKDTIFLGYPDGMLEPSLRLRRELTRLIRQYKPDVVVSGDPSQRFFGNSYMNHPDHRAAADVACDAVFPSAGTRLIFPELLHEGYPPHNVRYLYLHGSEKSDVWVDITSTIEFKVSALKQHHSQIGDWDVDKAMREWASSAGKEQGLAYAESFHRMVLIEEE
jgi:LmbE family N-acetylglucosaminyl deacetylase